MNLYCQSAVINFVHLSKLNSADTFYFDLVSVPNSLGDNHSIESEIISNKKNGDTNTTSVNYKIKQTTCALIGDGFGHEIIISPGDTVNIFCEPYSTGSRFLRDSLPSPWNFKMKYSGKGDVNFSFFDLLTYFDGGINKDHLKFNFFENNLSAFFKKASEQYRNRLLFFNKYATEKKLQKAVYIYAVAEIKYAYLNNLLSVLSNGENSLHSKDIFKEYGDSLKAFNNNDTDLFFNTINYSLYLHSFINFFEHDFHTSAPAGDDQLALSFTSFATVSNQSIKDYFLTDLMKNYYKEGNLNYDSLLSLYRNICANSSYKNYIDSLYKPERGKLKITLTQGLANTITSPLNETLLFNQIFKGRPVIVDCWASWCVPCLKEIPFSKELENEYSGRIDFVYLSFDRNKNDWINKNKQLGFEKNSYLINKNFQSAFANYFNIVTIPRYLAFDKNGLLITKNAPRPSKKEVIKKLLENMIDKK